VGSGKNFGMVYGRPGRKLFEGGERIKEEKRARSLVVVKKSSGGTDPRNRPPLNGMGMDFEQTIIEHGFVFAPLRGPEKRLDGPD